MEVEIEVFLANLKICFTLRSVERDRVAPGLTPPEARENERTFVLPAEKVRTPSIRQANAAPPRPLLRPAHEGEESAHTSHSSVQTMPQCSLTEPDFRCACEIGLRSKSLSADEASSALRHHFGSFQFMAAPATVHRPESQHRLRPARTGLVCVRAWICTVRLQSFSESLGCFVTEALVRFLFEFRQPRLGAATGVFGLSAS